MVTDVFLLTASRHSNIPHASISNRPLCKIQRVDEILNRPIKYKPQPHYDAKTEVSELTRIANVLGIKDPYTRQHARRVAIYARRLSERIGLNATAVENNRLGGLLHDIGKIGLSTKILNNTHNQLSADMLAQVRLHPLMGAAILNNFNLPVPVIDIVQCHHEKMDGSGYPDGKKGDEICMGSRIMAVVDIYDALITDRPYRKGMSREKAIGILQEEVGQQKLDSGVVNELIDLVL